ncbi:uncharacterized protein LOC127350626 [Dicentrarchus labrax]|uniref:uncharacterized protein LOC127350626 n=1 Tax=Dicentrarchus labrax TaxID=13489 RepID=UPI0021F56406|nr:uncharacterized protein LOC127350626 [Dicentrarchus labrax]
MVDNIVTKPLGLVLIVAAHMVFNVSSQTKFTGNLGSDIILKFKFMSNVSLKKTSLLGVYIGRSPTEEQKIFQYTQGIEGDYFFVDPQNKSVSWQITNLTLNHSGSYWASLFDSEPPTESDKVQLVVQVENRSTTVPPMQSNTPIPEDSGSSSLIVTVLVVSPVVLLAAILPGLIWCLVRTKDNQQQPPPPQQQSSNPTTQETLEESKNVPGQSVIYSVLDFPKRPPTILEINPSDTEYAAVSYLTEKRSV